MSCIYLKIRVCISLIVTIKSFHINSLVSLKPKILTMVWYFLVSFVYSIFGLHHDLCNSIVLLFADKEEVSSIRLPSLPTWRCISLIVTIKSFHINSLVSLKPKILTMVWYFLVSFVYSIFGLHHDLCNSIVLLFADKEEVSSIRLPSLPTWQQILPKTSTSIEVTKATTCTIRTRLATVWVVLPITRTTPTPPTTKVPQ